MADTTLERIFESKAKSRLLKLFFVSPEADFDAAEICRGLQIRPMIVKNELKKFLNIGLINARMVREASLPVIVGKGKRKNGQKKKKKARTTVRRVFFANKDFFLYPELKNLVSKIAPKSHEELLGRMKRLGDVRLAILSGVFLKDGLSRTDIMIVGDRLHRPRITAFFKKIQAEIGKELNYAVMTTQEFRYRNEMNDRFVRDVLDAPHEKLIDKFGV